MSEGSTDIVRDEDIVRATVADVILGPTAAADAEGERGRIALKHLDHVGLACRDAAATRAFYEDLLGLPLVNTLTLPDPFRDDGAEYCHFFFEMADGNYLAFFDHPMAFTEASFQAKDGFHQHFAFEVKSDEEVQLYRARLESNGVSTFFIDHGLYHSLYFQDPNGFNLEITYKPPGTAEFELKARRVAHDLLDRWIASRPERGAP